MKTIDEINTYYDNLEKKYTEFHSRLIHLIEDGFGSNIEHMKPEEIPKYYEETQNLIKELYVIIKKAIEYDHNQFTEKK